MPRKLPSTWTPRRSKPRRSQRLLKRDQAAITPLELSPSLAKRNSSSRVVTGRPSKSLPRLQRQRSTEGRDHQVLDPPTPLDLWLAESLQAAISADEMLKSRCCECQLMVEKIEVCPR